MSIVPHLAKRFLLGKKKNNFLSFIALISLFGVGVGVAALTTVMGVMEGFESSLRQIITGAHSHIVLYSSKQLIRDENDLKERIETVAKGRVESISPYVFSEIMLANKARVVGSMLEGVDPATVVKVTEIEKHLIQGKLPRTEENAELPTIILGVNLAESLSAKIGDTVTVISPYFEKNSLQPRAKKFFVSGLLSTGMYEYDSKYSMVHIDTLREFFQFPKTAASAVKIKTNDPSKSKQLVLELQKELGYPYRARDWTELNRNLFYAIQLQKTVIFVILTAIVLVAAFNIMSTLMMMMSEKKREMSILKAMGLSSKKSSYVFISVGLLIGLAGVVAGICLGLGICFFLANTQLIKLPADVYFISFLPVSVELSTLGLIGVCALVVAFLATLYPAYSIASESPVEGLRYE
ncbi:MAG: ABC transporter permease [Oligoflexia bacterium]|nr:ABC transporter permease [Oligoflexia bacterium]